MQELTLLYSIGLDVPIGLPEVVVGAAIQQPAAGQRIAPMLDVSVPMAQTQQAVYRSNPDRIAMVVGNAPAPLPAGFGQNAIQQSGQHLYQSSPDDSSTAVASGQKRPNHPANLSNNNADFPGPQDMSSSYSNANLYESPNTYQNVQPYQDTKVNINGSPSPNRNPYPNIFPYSSAMSYSNLNAYPNSYSNPNSDSNQNTHRGQNQDVNPYTNVKSYPNVVVENEQAAEAVVDQFFPNGDSGPSAPTYQTQPDNRIDQAGYQATSGNEPKQGYPPPLKYIKRRKKRDLINKTIIANTIFTNTTFKNVTFANVTFVNSTFQKNTFLNDTFIGGNVDNDTIASSVDTSFGSDTSSSSDLSFQDIPFVPAKPLSTNTSSYLDLSSKKPSTTPSNTKSNDTTQKLQSLLSLKNGTSPLYNLTRISSPGGNTIFISPTGNLLLSNTDEYNSITDPQILQLYSFITQQDGSITSTANMLFLHMYTEEMRRRGISRIRCSLAETAPVTSIYVRIVPVNTDDNGSTPGTLVAQDTTGTTYFFAACAYVDETPSKVFLVNGTAGVETLQTYDLSREITGGKTTDCQLIELTNGYGGFG